MTQELSNAAAAMGRKGGRARAKNLTKEELSEIGRKAGLASGKARAKLKPLIGKAQVTDQEREMNKRDPEY